jgi:Ca-activated chloride channel family protein
MTMAVGDRFVSGARRLPLALALIVALSALVSPRTGAAARPTMPGARMVARSDQGQRFELPLVEESARVEIDDQHATAVIRRVYHNTAPVRVEGDFSFRTGDATNVAGFAYWNGEQKIVGEVMETSAARRVYTSTVARKRDPGLLEKTGEGAFSFRVFPIEPDERKRIELTLDRYLPRSDRVVEYRLPMAHPGAEVDIALRDDRRIRRITSPSHVIEATGVGTSHVRVRAGAGGDPRELVLRWELADAPFSLHAHAHKDPGQLGYVELSLAAPPLAADPGQDLTIVLDTSPSMAGEPFEQARIAAWRILQRLHGADRFNVILASDRAESLFSSPRWVTRSARREALSALRAVREGRGGDVADALAYALELQDTAKRGKTIVLLTDGRTSARSALAVALRDRSRARVFTVGFGAGVDRAALSRLAAEKRGSFTLVESMEAIPARIDRLAGQIAAPGLTHLTLEARGGELREVYPRALPDLFPGQELRVVARVAGEGPVRLTLHADAQGSGPVALSTTVDPAREPRRPWIGKLWARERVNDLLEEMALSGAREDRQREVIELALAYNIVTPYTSFLAIPANEVLTADASATLAEARRRKAAVLAQSPDALALMGADASSASAAPAVVAPMEQELLRPAPPPPAPAAGPDVSEAVVHGRGCAGCHAGEEDHLPPGVAVALAALALAVLRRSKKNHPDV